MTRRTTKRTDWHRGKDGVLTCSIGERGCRVRLFEKTKGGVFHRAVWRGGREDRRSLHTTDRDEALRLGRLLLAGLIKGEAKSSSERIPLTLRELWRRYSTECAEYLDNKEATRKDAAW